MTLSRFHIRWHLHPGNAFSGILNHENLLIIHPIKTNSFKMKEKIYIRVFVNKLIVVNFTL